MPEGPEIEIIYRGLKNSILKKTIDQVIVRNSKLRSPVNENLAAILCGRIILDILRIAKYLIIKLDNSKSLVIHLGMTGKLLFTKEFCPPAKHDHLIVKFADETCLYYNDVRRFGLIEIIPEESLKDHKFFANLGPDPLKDELEIEYLSKKLARLNKPIKNVIMTNEVMSCVGNIYASESLHMAKIHPEKLASELKLEEITDLILSIEYILNKAVEKRGSSFSDYNDSNGEKGEFQNYFKVYNRLNLPCFNCKSLISKIKISGRSSFFCNNCQN